MKKWIAMMALAGLMAGCKTESERGGTATTPEQTPGVGTSQQGATNEPMGTPQTPTNSVTPSPDTGAGTQTPQ